MARKKTDLDRHADAYNLLDEAFCELGDSVTYDEESGEDGIDKKLVKAAVKKLNKVITQLETLL